MTTSRYGSASQTRTTFSSRGNGELDPSARLTHGGFCAIQRKLPTG